MRVDRLVVLLGVLLCASATAAQEQRGSIDGVVKDARGAVLPGATVEARNAATGATLSTVCDATGKFRFPSVQAGVYDVKASLGGFRPVTIPDVLVALGQVKTLDFALPVGGVTESVQVTATSPVIDVKQSTRATDIRAEQVELLPHGRDFTTLVTQAPGANYEAKSGGVMIDGSSAAENRYIVDGMETTDLVSGRSGKNLIADFVEEVQVKSSGYTAEYGGSTGGVINVITKSGTNRFSGSVLTYWQGNSISKGQNVASSVPLPGADAGGTQATGIPTLRLNPVNTDLAEYVTYPQDTWNRFEPAANVGGPIAKDRAWFWVGYQPAMTNIDRTVTLEANHQTITVNQKRQVQYLTATQTAQIGDKLRTRIAYDNSWSKVTGVLPSLDGSDAVGTNYGKTQAFPNWLLSATADYTVSPKFFVGLRGGYFLNDQRDSNVPNVSRYTWPATSNVNFVGTNGVAVPATLQHPSGFSSVISNNAVDHDKLTRSYFQADGTWFGHAAGDHQLKFGVQLDRRANDVLSGELGHRVTIRWGQSLGGQRGPFGYYSVRSNAVLPNQGFITQGNVATNLVGLFAQDAWTVSNKFTINAGIRTERERVPAYSTEAGVPASPIQFEFRNKLGPRVGFAYDVNGDGRWKAYGSWGLFYDIFKMELPRGSFGGEKWLEYYYTLDTPDWATLDAGSGCPPACSGRLFRGPIDFRHPSTTPGEDIEPDLKPMRSQEAVFGLEHELNPTMAVSVRYVHKHLDRGIEDTGSIDAQQNEIYIIANPGEGLTSLAFCCPAVNLPKPRRQYNGVEFAFDKRYANNWFFRASYLLSRDYGNYPGLSESDENGRSSPNVGRLFDYPLIMFKQDGTASYGQLPTDRMNQGKVQLIYQLPFGTSVGFNEYMATGIPITREISVIPPNNFPVQYLGRSSDGRTDVLTQTDFYVQHEFKIGGNRRVQLNATVLNLFNQRASVNTFVTYNNGAGINFSEPDFYAGRVNFASVIAASQASGALVADPRFLQSNGWQAPMQARFGVKFVF